MTKINPFIFIPQDILYPGEVIAPLNPYTLEDCIIEQVYYVTTFGRIFSYATGRFVEKQLQVNGSNYLETQIITNKGRKHLLVHRAVLSTFCPQSDMYQLQVDHIHGNHFDNRLSELRWINPKEQSKEAWKQGINSSRSRAIPDEIIIRIIQMANDKYSDEKIAFILNNEQIKISSQTVRIIRTGQAIYAPILIQLGLKPVIYKQCVNLSTEDYNRILHQFNSGMSINEISQLNNISTRTTKDIINRLTKPEIISINKVDPFIEIPDFYYNNTELFMINIRVNNNYLIYPLYAISKNGRIFSIAKGKNKVWREMSLRCDKHTKGHCVVGLQTDCGMKQFKVARIMMATFYPRSDMYSLEVEHLNGDKTDNRLENLRWNTHKSIMKNVTDNGIIKSTIQRAPDEDIIKIVNLAWSGNSDEKISELMDNKYTPHNVRIIRSGLKTYEAVLNQLGLKPFKYQKGAIDINTKKEIFEYITSIKDDIGMMESYKEAGKKFDISPETARNIYGQLKNK